MRPILLILSLALGATTLQAATRLTYELHGEVTPVAWSQSSFPVPVSIGRAATQNLPTGEALIRGAFNAWEGVEGSGVSFSHAGITDAPAGKDGKNVVTINDELFAMSGFLAYTTTWFDERTGILEEADIQIDSSATKGIAMQTLVEHEIGHLLGFDHSAILSSVMFPWVGSANALGFENDDRIALATIYPDGASKAGRGSIEGVVRMPGAEVFGAQVVAVDAQGAPFASTLSGKDGSYSLQGLPPGDYRLYAEPLDGPVETSDLSGIWRSSAVNTRFRTEMGEPTTLAAGEIKRVDVGVANLPNELNPQWIGAFPTSSSEIRLSSTAVSVRGGTTMAIAVGGDGFVSGMTEFRVLSPAFSRVSEFSYGTNYTWATFRIDRNAPASSVVILANNGEATATLTGALRVEAAGGRQRVAGR